MNESNILSIFLVRLQNAFVLVHGSYLSYSVPYFHFLFPTTLFFFFITKTLCQPGT
jgi:hypothetical protein